MHIDKVFYPNLAHQAKAEKGVINGTGAMARTMMRTVMAKGMAWAIIMTTTIRKMGVVKPRKP